MSGYDHYDSPRRAERSSRHYRDDRYDDRDARYLEAGDSHLRVHSSRDLVPRVDSDLSIEEIRRDFPPPGHRDIGRARSAGPYYDDYDDRRSYYSRDSRDRDYDRYDRDRDYDHRSSRRGKEGSVYEEKDEKRRLRVLSNQERIIAALAGAAIAVGSKELYDRHEAKQDGSSEVRRNPLASAALGAAGALAGYSGAGLYNKHAEKEASKHKGRDGQLTRYYSDDEEDTKEKKGHKNFIESALAAAGLGGAVKALTGGDSDDKDKDKDKSRDRGRSETRSRAGSRTRSKSPEKKNKIQQSATAALIAGATEAFRVAKEPGGWKGEKAKRIVTAAAGAATIDAAQNPDKNQKLSLAESVIGGLLGNRVLHGSKKNIEEDKATGRSRSRSRHRGADGSSSGGVSGLAALATAGLGAFGAKKIMDNRDKAKEDEEHSRRRSRSGSRDGSPDRRARSRSRSVVDSARRGLARIGIGNGPSDDRDKKSDYGSPRASSRGPRRRRHSDDSYGDYSRDNNRGGRRRDGYDDDGYRRRSPSRDRDRSRSRGPGTRRRGGSGSDTDLGDSDQDNKQTRRRRDGRDRY